MLFSELSQNTKLKKLSVFIAKLSLVKITRYWFDQRNNGCYCLTKDTLLNRYNRYNIYRYNIDRYNNL